MNAADAMPYRGGRVPPSEAEKPTQRSPLACAAHGCPCVGTVDNGGGFACPWHAWTRSDRWQQTTQLLRQQMPLLEAIGELQELYRTDGKGKPWVHRSQRLFAGEPDMQPSDLECEVWTFYLWRLREELAYRVETRADRPAPRVRQKLDPIDKPSAKRVLDAVRDGVDLPAPTVNAALRLSGDLTGPPMDDEELWRAQIAEAGGLQ